MKNKIDLYIPIALVLVLIGFIIGIYYAKNIWTTQADRYFEAKHQYDYCPFCGEYLMGD